MTKEVNIDLIGCQVGRWVVERWNIWQMKLLNEKEFAEFATDRGIKFSENRVKKLWQLKLLRADVVISKRKLRNAGLIEIEYDESGYYYADARRPRRRKNGWREAAVNLPPLDTGIQLLFHPFRYYVLYHLDRVLRVNTVNPNLLFTTDRYQEIVERDMNDNQEWSSKTDFTRLVDRWNSETLLCVAAEPCAYERVFSMRHLRWGISKDEYIKGVREHWEDLKNPISEIGIDKIYKTHDSLEFDANSIEPNKNLHAITRLANYELREDVKGDIGGALLLLTMAEMLRRVTEEVFDVLWPEEYGPRFGFTPQKILDKYFGPKMLDSRRVAKGYLQRFGLNYGVHIRCYLEGDTEYGALSEELGDFSFVELINLKGQFKESGRKGLAFRENLDLDIKSQIFSVILIDGDHDDYVRVLKKAAIDDQICGMFHISKPDFEFDNFTIEELEKIIWEMALENDVDPSGRSRLHKAISQARSGGELEKDVRRALPELNQFKKDENWGRNLMKFARENEEFRDPATGEMIIRPINDFIRWIIRSFGAGYQVTRKYLKIDPETGLPIERNDR